MKICLINNLYKPYNKGGAEKILEYLSEAFKEAGDKVCLISTKPRIGKQKDKELNNVYYLKSFYYNLAKIPYFLRIFWHIWDCFDVFSFFKVRKILKKEKPDLVISNNLKGLGFLLPFLFKVMQIKHIHILHDVQLFYPSGLLLYGEEEKLNSFFNKIYAKISAFLFASPDLVISPSSWLLDEHLKRGFFKKSLRKVLKNPFKSPKILTQKNNNQKKNSFSFLYVGQIEKEKGVLLMLRAFRDAQKEIPDLKLNIIGSGGAEKELEALIKNAKNIKFYGKQESETVYEFMQKSSVLIVPSYCYENSPNVINEAIYFSLPVIASHLGGMKDFSLLFFKPRDLDDLRKKISFACHHYDKLNKIFKQNKKTYSPQEYVREIKKTFNLSKS